jgi:hypothetical protein
MKFWNISKKKLIFEKKSRVVSISGISVIITNFNNFWGIFKLFSSFQEFK